MRVKVIPAAQAVQWVAAKPDKTVGASFGAVSINTAAGGLGSCGPSVEVSARVAGEADTLGSKSGGVVLAASGSGWLGSCAPPVEVSAGVAGEADTLGGKAGGVVLAAPGRAPRAADAGTAWFALFDPLGEVPDRVVTNFDAICDKFS